MKRRTRKNPTATIRDFTEGPLIPDTATAYIESLDPTVVDLGDETGRIEIGGAHGASFPWPGTGWSSLVGKPEITYVSRFVPLHGTYEEAIEAAIDEAAEKPGGVVDFEGIHYVTTATVSVVDNGVTLANGGIVPTGQFRALSVVADDVTVRNMTFSRSTSASVLDTLDLRSCVSVNGERFTSIDCRYLAANLACVYLGNGVADGATIRGGEMTGAAGRQSACGVYGAAGATGNRNITVEGVHIHDCTDSISLFDTGYSTIRGNRIEHLRKLPTITLTGWELVSGNIYRQRTAAGTPGVDGASTDRVDGSTLVVVANGVNLTGGGGSSPTSNKFGTSGGYVYINLGGTDPSTVTVTSGIVSGYGPMVYVTGDTGANEHLCSRNIISENRVEDVDGFGIYLQLGYYAGAIGNQVIGNSLRNVCLEGIQTSTLPFAGIGVNGGNDTVILGGVIDGVGTVTTKPAPIVDVIPSPTGLNTDPSGQIVGLAVRNGTADGFLIRSSNWLLTGCRSRSNVGNGYRVWTSTAGAVIENVEINGCRGSSNGNSGVFLDGSTSTIGYISARVIGGAFNNNTNRGVAFYSDTSVQTIRDSAVIGAHLRGNGAATFHAQVHLRGACRRPLVDDCTMASATTGNVGLSVDAQVVSGAVGINHYDLTIPELLNTPVRVAGARGGEQWRGAGSPEAVVGALVGATFQRSDGSAGTTLYVKESGTGSTGWVPIAGLLAAVNLQTGTTYTLALTDLGKTVEFSNASAVTLTVPLNSSVAFPVGTVIPLHQYGAGQVTVVPEGVAIVNGKGGANKISARYGTAYLRKRATNEWELTGDIST